METVIVERLYPQPMSAESIVAAMAEGRWCLDLYGVAHGGSYLAAGGTHGFCVYRSPDSEAVRSINRRLSAPSQAVWRGAYHPGGDDPDKLRDGEAMVVVERSFDRETGLETLSKLEAAGRWCLDRHRVRFLHTYVAADGRRMLCVYAAPDAESVRIAQRTIGMPLDRVWPGQRVLPPG